MDGVADVYYLLGIKSSPTPVLLKEKDITAADTVIGGSPLTDEERTQVLDMLKQASEK